MNGHGTGVSYWMIALPVFGMGLGMGLCVSILTNVIVAEVPSNSAGAASGVLNAILQLGAAAGIAVVGAVFVSLADGRRGGDLYHAAPAALWYNAAAFLVAALLTTLLPRAARGRQK
jgi:MFS family permease